MSCSNWNAPKILRVIYFIPMELDPSRGIGFTKPLLSFEALETMYRLINFLPNLCHLGATSFLYVLDSNDIVNQRVQLSTVHQKGVV